jgi:hypothetical protein
MWFKDMEIPPALVIPGSTVMKATFTSFEKF